MPRTEHALVFEGTAGLYLIDSFRRGVVGTMPATDLVWALVARRGALFDGDFDRAYEIEGPFALTVSPQTRSRRRRASTASSPSRSIY
jgi:4-hydroxy-tetrahydrodipicolinate synthase